MAKPAPKRNVPGSRTGRRIIAVLDLSGHGWTLRIIWDFARGTPDVALATHPQRRGITHVRAQPDRGQGIRQRGDAHALRKHPVVAADLIRSTCDQRRYPVPRRVAQDQTIRHAQDCPETNCLCLLKPVKLGLGRKATGANVGGVGGNGGVDSGAQVRIAPNKFRRPIEQPKHVIGH